MIAWATTRTTDSPCGPPLGVEGADTCITMWVYTRHRPRAGAAGGARGDGAEHVDRLPKQTARVFKGGRLDPASFATCRHARRVWALGTCGEAHRTMACTARHLPRLQSLCSGGARNPSLPSQARRDVVACTHAHARTRTRTRTHTHTHTHTHMHTPTCADTAPVALSNPPGSPKASVLCPRVVLR